MGQSQIRYCRIIKLSLRAYNAWKDYDDKFDYYLRNNGSQVCICKPDDQKSCIIVELKVDGAKCFVQVRECKWDPPGGQKETSRNTWNLGTVLVTCHTYASSRYNSPSSAYTDSSNFATGLVQIYMQAPSCVIQIPSGSDVGHLIPLGKKLGMNLQLCSELASYPGPSHPERKGLVSTARACAR